MRGLNIDISTQIYIDPQCTVTHCEEIPSEETFTACCFFRFSKKFLKVVCQPRKSGFMSIHKKRKGWFLTRSHRGITLSAI